MVGQIDWDAAGQFMDHYGLPLVLLAFLGLAAWRGGRWVGHRLFDAETGILSGLGKELVAFLRGLKEMLEKSLAGQEAALKGQQAQTEMCRHMQALHDKDGPCSTIPLRKAAAAGGDALVALAEGDREAVKRHVAAAKDHLGLPT